MNIFTIRVDFGIAGKSDFSFEKIEDATRFMGKAIDLGRKATFSRSSMHTFDNSVIALEAMLKATKELEASQ